MKRIYFLMPDATATKRVVDALNGWGVHDKDIGVVASDCITLTELPEASIWDTTQLARGIEGGLLVGGVAGLLGSLLAVTLPPAGIVLAGSAVLATSAAGAGFGAMVSGLIAKDIPKKDIEELRGAITAGFILMLVDVPAERVSEVIGTVQKIFPNTVIHTKPGGSSSGGPVSIVER